MTEPVGPTAQEPCGVQCGFGPACLEAGECEVVGPHDTHVHRYTDGSGEHTWPTEGAAQEPTPQTSMEAAAGESERHLAEARRALLTELGQVLLRRERLALVGTFEAAVRESAQAPLPLYPKIVDGDRVEQIRCTNCAAAEAEVTALRSLLAEIDAMPSSDFHPTVMELWKRYVASEPQFAADDTETFEDVFVWTLRYIVARAAATAADAAIGYEQHSPTLRGYYCAEHMESDFTPLEPATKDVVQSPAPVPAAGATEAARDAMWKAVCEVGVIQGVESLGAEYTGDRKAVEKRAAVETATFEAAVRAEAAAEASTRIAALEAEHIEKLDAAYQGWTAASAARIAAEVRNAALEALLAEVQRIAARSGGAGPHMFGAVTEIYRLVAAASEDKTDG